MKFTIQRDTLLKPLQMVNGIVERRQTLPILSNVLLVIDGEHLHLTTTDLEVEMHTRVTLAAVTAGEITVAARKLLDICRALPEGAEISVAVDGERAVIRSGKSRFVLSTQPAANFPAIDVKQGLVNFSLPQAVLRRVIERTQFAMAQQDVRYYLNGMLMEVEGTTMRVVATDGHRLAQCELELSEKIEENQSIIIPRKAVVELARLLSETDAPVRVSVGHNFIRVETEEMGFTSKLIDGRFPDYRNVVPVGGDKNTICEREQLRQTLARVSILSNEKYRGVRMQLSPGTMKVLAHNPEQEEAEEEIAVDHTGGTLEIGFNVNYLLDAVSAVDTDQVKLVMTDQNSCCLVHGLGEKRCKYVVMPMRL